MRKKLFLITIMLLCCFTFILAGCNDSGTPQKYTINIQTNLTSNCTIYGDGSYYYGESITIAVAPHEGYEFVEWSDGIESPIREVSVYGNKTYTAQIKVAQTQTTATTYALDKVELYAVEYGTLIAKSVEFESFSIYSGSQLITECNMLGLYSALNTGAKIVEYTAYNNESIIKADVYAPLVFYSSRNDANQFAKNVSKTLKFNLSINCHSGYINSNNEYVYDDTNGLNHGGALVNEKTQSFTVANYSLTQIYTLYTDTAHGYKIMVKLHFVEM